jgi:hypothetical protein
MTPESDSRAPGEAGVGHLQLKELQCLYSALSPEGRDELLQCLLITAPRGEEAMVKVLEDLMLCHATEELLEGALQGDEDDPR